MHSPPGKGSMMMAALDGSIAGGGWLFCQLPASDQLPFPVKIKLFVNVET